MQSLNDIKGKLISNRNSAYAFREDGSAGTKLGNSQAPYTLQTSCFHFHIYRA